MKILLLVTILLVLAFVMARYSIRLHKEARRCSLLAQKFQEKLAALSSPDHLFTDEELRKLKIEFDPLLDAVNKLYDSHFISDDYLEKLKLHDFMEKRKLLNHIQMTNNRAFRGM